MSATTQQRIFLTAEWKNLAMLNYCVSPELLRPFVPPATELDHFEGRTYVSLIGFEFNGTRLFGRAIPLHQSFEEVNLRFYVRRASRRGVVFVRELVPKIAVAAVARLAYGERYSCVPMSHRISSGAAGVRVEYLWGAGRGRCSLALETKGAAFVPSENSLSQFITEHYWGYAVQGGRTVEYQVEHPQWAVREAATATFAGEGARYYGSQFGEMLAREPDSAFLAEGSTVTVFRGETVDRDGSLR